MKAFIKDLGIRNFILFGHSLGGPIAIELAKLLEDKVHALILSEPNLDPSMEGSGSYQIAQFCEKEFLGQKYSELITENKLAGNTMWAATLSNCSPTAVYRLSQCAFHGGRPSWRTILYELSMFKGVIFGEYSLPDTDYEDLPMHDIHVETVPSAGHSMAWENPPGLAFAISSLLKLSLLDGLS